MQRMFFIKSRKTKEIGKKEVNILRKSTETIFVEGSVKMEKSSLYTERTKRSTKLKKKDIRYDMKKKS